MTPEQLELFIQRERSQGRHWNAIAEALNQKGVLNPSGKRWTAGGLSTHALRRGWVERTVIRAGAPVEGAPKGKPSRRRKAGGAPLTCLEDILTSNISEKSKLYCHTLYLRGGEIMSNFWSYGVRVRGIKKRCRKPDLHIQSDLDRDELPNEEKAKALARQWIERNMKAITKAEATVTYWASEDGASLMTWQPFNKDHNLSYPLE